MGRSINIQEELDKIEAIWSSNKPEAYSRLTWEKEQFVDIVQSPIFKTVFPEKRIDRKFRKLLKPFIFGKGDKTIYCRYNGICFEDERPTRIFSAITKEMIDVDAEFFSSNTLMNSALGLIYKPYTYELSFDEPLPENFYRENSENEWYEVTVRKYKEKQEGKRYGRLSYGASPLDHQVVEIEWGNKVSSAVTGTINDLQQTEVDAYYGRQDPNVIKSWLDWLFNNNTNRDLFICRVGQANAVLGVNELKGVPDKRYFAFDVGLPNDENIEWNGASIDRKATGLYDEDVLSRFIPGVVFISHWHTDHFKGAFTLSRDVFVGPKAAMWIAPCYAVSKKQNNANRLVAYLMKTGRIAFADDTCSYTNNHVALYRVNTHQPDDLNNDGILLQLETTLLPGDCFYDMWPGGYGMANQIKYVVTSHHASKSSYTYKSEKKLDGIFNKKGEKAYICVGKNAWKHPCQDVIDMFKEPAHLKFNDVISTIDDTRKGSEFIITDL